MDERAVAVGFAPLGVVAHDVHRARDPDPIEKAYVNRCLAQKGYEVLGWR